ncbi:preprotein translocase subunit Sec61beta [Candidatus Pacearchaeota archaeon]|jgi:preprotein translocase subunit Sec61beta|nr:preprotein translocase subunit Sec61beta [Candidatus Pacearchaeota archaeon]
MASNNKINLPGGFGGLMRYSEEYNSYINLKPIHVVLLVISIVAFRILMPLIFK